MDWLYIVLTYFTLAFTLVVFLNLDALDFYSHTFIIQRHYLSQMKLLL